MKTAHKLMYQTSVTVPAEVWQRGLRRYLGNNVASYRADLHTIPNKVRIFTSHHGAAVTQAYVKGFDDAYETGGED
jgi:hypothetical protein